MTLIAIATHRARPLKEFVPEIPESVSDLVERMLSSEPSDRPANAIALAEELDYVKEGLAFGPLDSSDSGSLFDEVPAQSELADIQPLQVATEVPVQTPQPQPASTPKAAPSASDRKSVPVPILIAGAATWLLIIVGILAYVFRGESTEIASSDIDGKGSAVDVNPSDKPKSGNANADKRSSENANANKAKSGNSNGNKPKSGNSNANKPKSGNSNANKPKSGNPNANKPKSGNPNASKPKSDNSNANQPSGNKVDPNKLEPSNSNLNTTNTRANSGRVMPDRSEEIKPVAVKSSPAKTEPVKSEPIKSVAEPQPSGPFQWIRLSPDSGADVSIGFGSAPPNGSSRNLMVHKKSPEPGVLQALYLKFDISSWRQPVSKIADVEVALTCRKLPEPIYEVQLYGVPYALLGDWTDRTKNALRPSHAVSTEHLDLFKLLATKKLTNDNDSFKFTDGNVRFSDRRIAEFCRDEGGNDDVTFAVVPATASKRPALFVSRESSNKFAPQIGIR